MKFTDVDLITSRHPFEREGYGSSYTIRVCALAPHRAEIWGAKYLLQVSDSKFHYNLKGNLHDPLEAIYRDVSLCQTETELKELLKYYEFQDH